MKSLDVVVVGSANADLVLTVAEHVAAGETALALDRADHAGGKGLNQAVAAARAGATTAFIAALGDDGAGRMLRDVIDAAGIDAARVRTTDQPTGLAVVMVDSHGENSIVVASGANAELTLEPADISLVESAKILVLQLEIPLETVRAAASAARAVGVRVVLNAAPARDLAPELLDVLDLLVVNKHEALALAPAADPKPTDESLEDLCGRLLALVPSVVVTLGGDGAVLAQRGSEVTYVHAPHAKVVDTTGAGDTFTGALAAALAEGQSLGEAAWFGACAGSLAVETSGAVPSIPTRAAIAERQRTTLRHGSPDLMAPRQIDLPTPVPLEVGVDLSPLDEAKIFAAPDDPADWRRWREQLLTWRTSAHERFAYDSSRYDDARTSWTQRSWNVAIVWLWDEALYDWARGSFDVDRLVATYAEFGGLDGVVLWHAYPVIGIDPRNQLDYYREVPGLAELVQALQSRHIRVFVDYNPWDVGTRRPEGTDAVEIAKLVGETRADGVFLDTLKEGDTTLRDALLALDPPPALEGESRVPTSRIGDHQLSWAQWMADSDVPGVLRARLFEQRHMMHHTRRWNTDHSDELQSAWVNGVGVLIWDVVFGSYVGWSERDKSTLRAMRRAYEVVGDCLTHGTWTPLPESLAPEAVAAGVYGSSYRLDGVVLWTFVNRGAEDYVGPLVIDGISKKSWYDVLAGEPVRRAGQVVDGCVPARGIAGLLALDAAANPPEGLDHLLTTARQDVRSPDDSVRALPVVPVEPAVRAGATAVGRNSPEVPAVTIPAGRYGVPYRFRIRETGMRMPAFRPGTWKPLPPLLHSLGESELNVWIGGTAVDAAEVSNRDFAVFLAATDYRPVVENRFLAHWMDGAPPVGSEDAPVTYVDLDDARAYATWRGARLPTEAEWQLAAAADGWRRGDPLVWNWTESERRDGRTRWSFVKGGSWFAASGSDWYVDGGPQEIDWSLRLLLLGGGLARSECIGFRCAADLSVEAGGQPPPPRRDAGWLEYRGD